MVNNHHDTGYKELFSYPEFVQQLIEGFAPAEIARLMDFSTLKSHSGSYITPLFEEKIEDVVWSVNVNWQGMAQEVYLYILLEFQSSVDRTMPVRLMHYAACFYSELLKQKVITPGQGLPPVFPVVLYNGSERWSASLDLYDMIMPEPPGLLQVYQPRMRYYLVDEGRYTDEQLGLVQSPLSGVFSIEKASTNRQGLQQAVDRIVAIIQADPHKERIDKIITRWLKRHLQRLGAEVDLNQLNSLVEDKDMLAENLENWAQQERQEGEKLGIEKGEKLGIEKGEKLGIEKTARNLLKLGVLSDEQIAEATGLALDEVAKLRDEGKR
ncbi:Rpn family recombination-promoting nuclease/putative transposase [Vreelandella gomseomensis]|uniref:Rpn family recombination-promoting nuclease/putative transposase n=1 Tax=Vreelandella gomseomensis TaxID=370766 RepID=A0ABU1GFN0_9GAMM|nr:Rpn family recombination-promoting nuclease/putative transposase [Halomonas gomseomensis]MDR5876295.1 Rpn family recombination-promoting nuclease/putative transposase [Halomonas gomseomensis]